MISASHPTKLFILALQAMSLARGGIRAGAFARPAAQSTSRRGLNMVYGASKRAAWKRRNNLSLRRYR